MRSDRRHPTRLAVSLSVLLLAACTRASLPPEAPTATSAAKAVAAVPPSESSSPALEAESGRRLGREQQAAWLRLPEPQRARLRDARAAFNALPVDEQTALRAEFATQDGSDQRGWLLGPDAGAAWPHLQPLLAQVPEAQREPLLRILHDMPLAELHALERIAWRTPPAQRDRIRQELIATTPSNRMAWLIAQSQQ